jgi:hypothetical protein
MKKIFLLLIIITIIYFIFIFDDIKIIYLTNENDSKNKYHDKIKIFEKKLSNWYPIGNDFFNISHGANYYDFFDRIGKLEMIIGTHNNNVIATGCGVLRNMSNGDKVWYIADLKVDKKHRGKKLSFKLAMKALSFLKQTNKIYAISMNEENKDNNIIKITKNIPFINMKYGNTLLIYSLDYKQMDKIFPLLQKYRSDISFTSLHMIKDLTLKSTNKPMNILHLQWSPKNKIKSFVPIKNYKHMFCLPITDPLIKLLNIKTDITATIIHNNMDNYDWSFIETSEI